MTRFQHFETIRSFPRNISGSKITLDEAYKNQTNLGNEFIKFDNELNEEPKKIDQKKYESITELNLDKWLLVFLKVEYFQ